MSININIADDERSAQVNGKNVYQDINNNWLASGEPLTDIEKRTLFYHLKKLGKLTQHGNTPLFFCKVKKAITS